MKQRLLQVGLIFLLCLLLPLLSGCGDYVGGNEKIQRALEKCYFEGQRDALRGDIRIQYDEKIKGWRWAKTPWDDGRKAAFDPSNEK